MDEGQAIRLNTREQGEGAPVLLLHGLFGQARNLATLQAALAANHRVIAADLRNHGQSPHAAGMQYAALAADVADTLDGLGVARAAVLGHSMGGKVAMRLALDAPERVSRLVVADIAPVPYDVELDAGSYAVAPASLDDRHAGLAGRAHEGGQFARFARALQALALTPGLTRAGADAALSAEVADPGLRGFLLQGLVFGAGPAGAPHWRIGLAEIAAGLDDVLGWDARGVYAGPALFVAGARSTYIAASHHPAILAQFPDATFAMVADAGHWLHVDNPAGFLAVVQPFLAGMGG